MGSFWVTLGAIFRGMTLTAPGERLKQVNVRRWQLLNSISCSTSTEWSCSWTFTPTQRKKMYLPTGVTITKIPSPPDSFLIYCQLSLRRTSSLVSAASQLSSKTGPQGVNLRKELPECFSTTFSEYPMYSPSKTPTAVPDRACFITIPISTKK